MRFEPNLTGTFLRVGMGRTTNTGTAIATTDLNSHLDYTTSSIPQSERNKSLGDPRAIRMLVHATPLSIIDRVGGGAFGLLRGSVLLIVLATVVSLTPAAQSVLWQSSTGARWTTASVKFINALLPPDLRQWLPGT